MKISIQTQQLFLRLLSTAQPKVIKTYLRYKHEKGSQKSGHAEFNFTLLTNEIQLRCHFQFRFKELSEKRIFFVELRGFFAELRAFFAEKFKH